MKKIIIILFSLVHSFSFSQETEIEKMKKDIEELQKKLLDKREIEVGTIDFKLDNINLYKKNTETPQDKINIKKIILSIIDGCIVRIKVYGENNIVYHNHDASISITNARFEKLDRLQTADKTEFIYFSDLLKDYKIEPYTSKDDENVIIDKDNLIYKLMNDVSLNSIIDARLYSDVLGFFGEEKNSVVQTEVKSKFIINRTNFINRQVIPFNYFNIFLNYNKIDSKNRFIDTDNFNYSDLLQKSIFNAEISLNIFKCNLSKNNSHTQLYSDVGTTFSWNKIVKNLDTLTSNNVSLFIEIGIKTKLYKQLGVNTGVRLIRLMSPETKEFNQDLHAPTFNFLKFNLDLFYIVDEEKKYKWFCRFNYFKSTNSELTQSQFPQIQVGYSKTFTELF